MLPLTRKPKQSIVIGDDITIRVMRVQRNQVQVGIDAPPHIRIHRQEIYEQVLRANQAAADQSALSNVLGAVKS